MQVMKTQNHTQRSTSLGLNAGDLRYLQSIASVQDSALLDSVWVPTVRHERYWSD